MAVRTRSPRKKRKVFDSPERAWILEHIFFLNTTLEDLLSLFSLTNPSIRLLLVRHVSPKGSARQLPLTMQDRRHANPAQYEAPRHGSLAYLPRKRATRHRGKVKS